MIPARVVVINLERRPDRLAAFLQRFGDAAPGVAVQRIPAPDMPDDPRAGCWYAHIAALDSGPGPVLVLEDDAVFTDTFTLRLPDPPADWRLLRLGGQVVTALGALNGGWLPVGRAQHTHAYIAADPQALASHMRGSPARDAGQALTAGVAGQYRLWPGTVGQAAGTSDIAGRGRPTDEFWG